MKIIQLTDLHIGREGEKPFDVDVRANFQRILARVVHLAPDHLIVSGDLCLQDPDRQVYRWIRTQLDAAGLPYDLLSGNHDDPAMIAEAFDRPGQFNGVELYFFRDLPGCRLFCLDTTTGIVSTAQLEWLAGQLQQQHKEAVIFMHHPPMLAGVPHMDRRYALQNGEAVQGLFSAHPHPVHVFCGHYHVDKILRRDNLTVYISPSSYFQIDQHTDDFRVDHRQPGFREITLAGNTLTSTVCYVRE